jgi:hypothetical protein
LGVDADADAVYIPRLPCLLVVEGAFLALYAKAGWAAICSASRSKQRSCPALRMP